MPSHSKTDLAKSMSKAEYESRLRTLVASIKGSSALTAEGDNDGYTGTHLLGSSLTAGRGPRYVAAFLIGQSNGPMLMGRGRHTFRSSK